MDEIILSEKSPPQVGDVLKHNGWVCMEIVNGFAYFYREDSVLANVPCYSMDESFYTGLTVTRPAKKVTGELVGVVPVGADRYITWYCPVGGSSKICLPTNDAYAVIRLPKEDK